MLLSELFPGDPRLTGEVEIRGLTADSRAVQPGYLFAALTGGQADGADFIGDALKRGAAAVLTGREAGLSTLAGGVPLIVEITRGNRLKITLMPREILPLPMPPLIEPRQLATRSRSGC